MGAAAIPVASIGASVIGGIAQSNAASKAASAQLAAANQANATPKANAGTNILSMAQIQQAAKDHGVSVEEAKRQATAAGYQVK